MKIWAMAMLAGVTLQGLCAVKTFDEKLNEEWSRVEGVGLDFRSLDPDLLASFFALLPFKEGYRVSGECYYWKPLHVSSRLPYGVHSFVFPLYPAMDEENFLKKRLRPIVEEFPESVGLWKKTPFSHFVKKEKLPAVVLPSLPDMTREVEKWAGEHFFPQTSWGLACMQSKEVSLAREYFPQTYWEDRFLQDFIGIPGIGKEYLPYISDNQRGMRRGNDGSFMLDQSPAFVDVLGTRSIKAFLEGIYRRHPVPFSAPPMPCRGTMEDIFGGPRYPYSNPPSSFPVFRYPEPDLRFGGSFFQPPNRCNDDSLVGPRGFGGPQNDFQDTQRRYQQGSERNWSDREDFFRPAGRRPPRDPRDEV